jgi:outer membrane protein assembly factor BamA
MRWVLARIGVVFAVWLLASHHSAYAQQTIPDSLPEIQSDVPCPVSDAREEEPTSPEISIAEVTFSGFFQLPISDQDQIADSIKENTLGTSLEAVTDEALERVREGWQNRGYFMVQIAGDTKTLTSSPVSRRIAISIHIVNEGAQYKLGRITFKNNKAITNVKVLRSLFPIADGEIFSREKIRKGLENLSKTYGEFGYINFTSVPNTKFASGGREISLEIDLDEGQQFYVSSINVLGLDDAAREELLKSLPIKRGEVYNSRLWETSRLNHASMVPECPCGWYNSQSFDEQFDEHSATVALTLDFRPCSN